MFGAKNKNDRRSVLPKVNFDDFVVTDLVDETLVYDLRNHRAHCLNRVAAIVWRHCDGQSTVSQVVQRLQVEARIPADEGVVVHALEGLRKSELVEAKKTP